MKKILIWFIFSGLIITGNLLISDGREGLRLLGMVINGGVAGAGASALGQLLSNNEN